MQSLCISPLTHRDLPVLHKPVWEIPFATILQRLIESFLEQAAGYVGYWTALVAFYTGTAELLNSVYRQV